MDATDAAMVRKWADSIQLYYELGGNRDPKMIEKLVEGMGSKEAQYDAFRHRLRELILADIMKEQGAPRSPGEQASRLEWYLSVDTEVASQGKLFSEYRQKRLSLDKADPAYVPGIVDKPALSRQLPGGKAADGAIEVTAAAEGMPAKDRYLVDDKTGAKPYRKDQAERYSKLLDDGKGTIASVDGTKFAGVVYFFDSRAAAESAFKSAAAQKLNPAIHILYFDTGGALQSLR